MIKIKNQTVLASGQLILEPEDDVWVEFETKSWRPKFHLTFSDNISDNDGKIFSHPKDDHGEIAIHFHKGSSFGVAPLAVAQSDGKPITISAIVDHTGARLLFTYQFCLELDGAV